MSDVVVLCYHAVSPTWPASLSVTPEVFRRQMTALQRRGWQASTFSTAVLDPPAGRTVAVTFDDAFLSVLERAYPILAQLGMPATVFAPTAFMKRRQPLLWPGIEQWHDTAHASELQSMNWSDARRLSEAGWEIGSHTRTHPRLTRLDEDVLREELEYSRTEIAANIDRPCESVAYPYGDADERIARVTKSTGYRCAAWLSSSLSRRGVHLWPRIGVYHGDSGWRFSLKMSRAMRHARASRLWPVHE